ncbi:MAG TPA: sialidase family protein [Candidatus Bathyarchaeia archaeon]|nr:sialidase family protein [Candidatus Bathyarchaeia archaeon]
MTLLIMLALLSAPLDPRNISAGFEIPDEGYCDQPYVVVTEEGHWLCTLTTGAGNEGDERQHVVATISADRGRTWSPLIDIEPPGPPESSWVMPLKLPGGRIYAFYDYNAGNLREVLNVDRNPIKRVDTLGQYAFKYSDDGGRTWSSQRYPVPIRTFEIDRENVYGGEIQFFWGVGKPIIHEGAAYVGLSKVGGFGAGFIERSEGIFLRSDNILTEADPAKIGWETLPAGDVGLRAPAGPIAEEHNVTSLADGSLYCTYRTTQGHPCHAYSRDGGHTWTPPAWMTYAPGGKAVKHPRAANFVRRFGNGKYVYWFHNHGGKSYEGRNPVWVCGGIEKGGFIRWSQPEILLYDDDPSVRMSYPDFIEDGGRYFVTETQKSVARVHEIDSRLLDAVWNQFEAKEVAREGVALEVADAAAQSQAAMPDLEAGAGFSIDVAFAVDALDVEQTLLRSGGVAVAVTPAGAVALMSGENRWESDPGLVAPGTPHHAAVVFDGGPRILMFVVDGVLCDGADVREQGWYKLEPDIEFRAAPILTVECRLTCLRLYTRPLMVSEAVANARAAD